MGNIEATEIINIFNAFEKENIDYILLRNIGNELPSNLGAGKDIDILVSKKDEAKLIEFFDSYKYKTLSHPHKDDIYLYGVDKFVFKHNNQSNILFDLNFQIVVRSLEAGQWVPLDEAIQKSAWVNKRFEKKGKGFGFWSLSYNDEFVCLVARSIFDKKDFNQGYIKRINQLMPLVNRSDVTAKFKMVFFKFTPFLLELLESNDYEKIISDYIAFKEY